MPDLVGMLLEAKDKALELCVRLEPKYGKAEFDEPITDEEIARWESVNHIKIPDDYKAWLKFSRETKLKGIPLEFYPPEKFETTIELVTIGRKGDAQIAFLIDSGRYIAIEDGKRTNLGYMETIIRFWAYDAKELFAKEELEALRPIVEAENAKVIQAEKVAKAKGAGVKEAMEYFFARNNVAYLKQWRSFPYYPVDEDEIDCGLVISEPNSDGYCQWQPMLQNKTVDFVGIESKLGFEIHEDIKELISRYYYFALDADIEEVNVRINALLPEDDMEQVILARFDKEEYCDGYEFVLKGRFFLIGSCCIEGDDGFVLEVNNDTGEAFAVEYEDKRHVKIANSIYDLFMNAKPIYSE